MAGHLAVDLAAAPSTEDPRRIIAESLRKLTGAVFVGVSSYDVHTAELVLEYVAGEREAIGQLVETFGRDPRGIRIPVPPEICAHMLLEGTRTQEDLTGASLGTLPTPISRTLQEMFGIEHFAGLALVHGSQLIGTANLAMPRGKASPPPEVMRLFAHVAAASLQRHKAEQALQQKIVELGEVQAQLVDAANTAMVRELAAGVAHEINNPLTSILGSAEYLLERPGWDRRARRRLEAIVRQARKARDIIRSLLDYARQREYQRELVTLNDVVRSTLDMVRERMAQDCIALEEEYTPGLPLVRLDTARMKQALMNICANAIHAMPDGGTLKVWTAGAEGEIAAYFADSGKGIPTDRLSRIFEPFFTTRPPGEGTGLGLAISRSIVQEHGGRIEVESRMGAGSTFAVWLPVRAAEPQAFRVLDGKAWPTP
jgi:signal transduction histidine kinase